jgi:hypothetical protein
VFTLFACFCSKLPVLKSFLKNGDAECYEGITVRYVPGRSAVLTVYGEQEGLLEQQEERRYSLEQYRSLDDLHKLMTEAGFALKSEDDCQRVHAEALERQRDERFQRHKIHEYYRFREYYIQAFRRDVMGPSYVEAWNNRPRQSRPSGPEPDLLAENYDVINQKQAALKPDRYQYAVNYLLKHSRGDQASAKER